MKKMGGLHCMLIDILRVNTTLLENLFCINEGLHKMEKDALHIYCIDDDGKEWFLFQDYPCFIMRRIISEHTNFLRLLNNTDIFSEDVGALQCICRSLVENYADILNFSSYPDKYYNCLLYLNVSSDIRLLNSAKQNNQLDVLKRFINPNEQTINQELLIKLVDGCINTLKAEKIKRHSSIKNDFSDYKWSDKDIKFGLRTKRYELLEEFNKRHQNDEDIIMQQVLLLNNSINFLDSRLSQILHNNPETIYIDNPTKICELIRLLIYASYGALNAFSEYYNLNSAIFNGNEYWINLREDTISCLGALHNLAFQVGPIEAPYLPNLFTFAKMQID